MSKTTNLILFTVIASLSIFLIAFLLSTWNTTDNQKEHKKKHHGKKKKINEHLKIAEDDVKIGGDINPYGKENDAKPVLSLPVRKSSPYATHQIVPTVPYDKVPLPFEFPYDLGLNDSQKKLTWILLSVIKALDTLKINYWLKDTTLLGAVVEKGWLYRSMEGNLGISSDNNDNDKIRQIALLLKDFDLRVSLLENGLRIFDLHSCNTNLSNDEHKGLSIYVFFEDRIPKLTNLYFEGYLTPVPQEYNTLLKRKYGDNYLDITADPNGWSEATIKAAIPCREDLSRYPNIYHLDQWD